MDSHLASTPFGARPMSVALFSRQQQCHRISENTAIDKWKLYRSLCEAKSLLGVGDRTLAVLNALLSFYPTNMLSTDNNLVVFPSNKQLSLRAHGMADATLRRHIAKLLECGLIIRRDSPNGKRYAHKSKDGDIANAYGFSLMPLLARASEIEEAAQLVRAQLAETRLLRERLTLYRRDIAKLIEMAEQAALSGPWDAIYNRFRDIVDAIPRRTETKVLEAIIEKMIELRTEIDNTLILQVKEQNLSANADQIERQYNNSESESINKIEAKHVQLEQERTKYSLTEVLHKCSDFSQYSMKKISDWRDFITLASQIRSYLGIKEDTYFRAIQALGHERAAIIIACILQRVEKIQYADAYLNKLLSRRQNGVCLIRPILSALEDKLKIH